MIEIFGTLGPSCSQTQILRKMLEEGMTGIRLNMSHTSLHKSAQQLENYQKAQQLLGRKADLLIDLQGPELRIEAPDQELHLKDQETVLLKNRNDRKADSCQKDNACCEGREADSLEPESSFPEIFLDRRILDSICEGDTILLNDGAIELKAAAVIEKPDTEKAGSEWEKSEGNNGIPARVIRGGTLFGRKSIKIVGKTVEMPVLTGQDLENLDCAGQYGVTALMQPFVTSGEQLRQIREILREKGLADPETGLRLFAKIESREGVRALPDILPYADVIVIARGDLGNDVPLWELPGLQKQIAAACRAAGRPFLVVTQMLTSMISSAVPTRAEVSDIFNAVLDGACAVMVTNETAAGHYPAEVIRYMKKTCDAAENWQI